MLACGVGSWELQGPASEVMSWRGSRRVGAGPTTPPSSSSCWTTWPRDHPDPMEIAKFEWEVILRYLGVSPEEVKDVQMRLGRPWR